MKAKLLPLSLFIFSSLYNCQEKKENQNNKILTISNNMNTINIEDILTKQIKAGAGEEYGSYSDYGQKDLDALVSIEDTILKNNGYKTPNTDIFNQIIKNIFGRIIDNKTATPYLKIETYKDDVCNKELEYFPYSAAAQYLYVVKQNKFISYFYALPKILDYQKIYPKILIHEENPFIIGEPGDEFYEIPRWKTIKDLSKQRRFNQQLLISRNKYLFNDDRSQFVWLTHNDEYFMKSLVTTFGYTEDKKLLKWVFENTNLPNFYRYAKKEVLEEFEKLLWTKQCDREIKVHQNTLNLIKELSTPENNIYIMYTAEYLANYLEEKKDLTDQQKAKIAAYLLYFGEQYRYDESYDYNQMFMGFFSHYLDDGKYIKEFERNNYYGLPKFKEWYETAKTERDIFKDNEELPDSPQPLDYQDKVGVWEGFL